MIFESLDENHKLDLNDFRIMCGDIRLCVIHKHKKLTLINLQEIEKYDYKEYWKIETILTRILFSKIDKIKINKYLYEKHPEYMI